MRRVTATLAILVLVLTGITGSSSLVESVPVRPTEGADVDLETTRTPAERFEESGTASGHEAGSDPEPEPVGPVGAAPTAVFLPDSAAHVVAVGLNPDGSMEIPGHVSEVGWYSLTGVRPGDPGTAVLAGHVDSRTQGRGAFYELSRLAIDDEIVVDTVDGPQTWIVTSTTSHPRTDLPIADLFSLDGAPRLALVTCGGEFDRDVQSYPDNIVVYAHRTDVDGRV